MIQSVAKTVGMVAFSAVSAAFQQVYPLALLALGFVVADCLSAFRLARRVHKSCASKNGKGACGKFKSQKMAKTVLELIIIIPCGLLLAHWTQQYLFEGLNLRLPQIFAGIVIFWQVWSILENESSSNGAQWAKVLQKIMVDKTERHFDVDLSELKKEVNHDNEQQGEGAD